MNTLTWIEAWQKQPRLFIFLFHLFSSFSLLSLNFFRFSPNCFVKQFNKNNIYTLTIYIQFTHWLQLMSYTEFCRNSPVSLFQRAPGKLPGDFVQVYSEATQSKERCILYSITIYNNITAEIPQKTYLRSKYPDCGLKNERP